jgi:preprotein translocase subunit SecG
MVQNPKGGGLSSTFGGGGSSMGGVQNTNTFLDKSTWTLVIAMIVLILMTNLLADTGNINTKSGLQETLENRELIEEVPQTPTTETPVTPAEGTDEKK